MSLKQTLLSFFSNEVALALHNEFEALKARVEALEKGPVSVFAPVPSTTTPIVGALVSAETPANAVATNEVSTTA